MSIDNEYDTRWVCRLYLSGATVSTLVSTLSASFFSFSYFSSFFCFFFAVQALFEIIYSHPLPCTLTPFTEENPLSILQKIPATVFKDGKDHIANHIVDRIVV